MVRSILGYQPTIYVDDGHGENTPGKRTPKMDDGKIIKENQFNKPTANQFSKLAEAIGFRVIQVAKEDWDVALVTRTNRANSDFKELKQEYKNINPRKLAIFISFHYNAYDEKFGTNLGGVEVHYWPNSSSGKELASLILKQLVKNTSQRNRGIKASNFYVLRETSMVAVLIEAGFMDVKEEAELMLNEDFQNEVAIETLKGVCDYFNVPYPEEDLEFQLLKENIHNLRQQIDELDNKLQDRSIDKVSALKELEELKMQFINLNINIV